MKIRFTDSHFDLLAGQETIQARSIGSEHLDDVGMLMKTYHQWLDETEDIRESKEILEAGEQIVQIAEEMIVDYDISNELLNRFLNQLKDANTGHEPEPQKEFATAMVNQAEESPVKVDIDLDGLGDLGNGYFATKNTRDIEIRGNAEYSELLVGMKEGEVDIEGEVGGIAREMSGGIVNVDGDAMIAGASMKGGLLRIEGYGERVGMMMTGGHIKISGDAQWAAGLVKSGRVEILGDAEELGDRMEGGYAWSNGDVGELLNYGEGGTAWCRGDAEEVAFESSGGTVYVEGDAEKVGCGSEDTDIYVEGDIGAVGEDIDGCDSTCKSNVYNWQDGEWVQVAGDAG